MAVETAGGGVVAEAGTRVGVGDSTGVDVGTERWTMRGFTQSARSSAGDPKADTLRMNLTPFPSN